MTYDPHKDENHSWSQPLCARPDCYRGGPHFPFEYGCVTSNVWRTPTGQRVNEPACHLPGGNHKRGCGCPGDPVRELRDKAAGFSE